MAILTGLTSTVASAWSDNTSLMLYAHHDDTDYRLSPADMEKIVGIRGGCGVVDYAGESTTQSVSHPLAFTSIMYEEGAGWQNQANSPTCLIAPRAGIYQLMGVVRSGLAGNEYEMLIMKGNTRNNTPLNNARWEQVTTEDRHIFSMPMAANSGDIFTCVWQSLNATSSVNLAEFDIWPLGYL